MLSAPAKQQNVALSTDGLAINYICVFKELTSGCLLVAWSFWCKAFVRGGRRWQSGGRFIPQYVFFFLPLLFYLLFRVVYMSLKRVLQTRFNPICKHSRMCYIMPPFVGLIVLHALILSLIVAERPVQAFYGNPLWLVTIKYSVTAECLRPDRSAILGPHLVWGFFPWYVWYLHPSLLWHHIWRRFQRDSSLT